jgi:chemotaxis protein methyltransferase CheR
MALDQAGWFDRLPIEIHASDASAAALAKAGSGQYRERSFRALAPALREQYFSESGGVSTVVPALRARISSWSLANLMDQRDAALHVGTPVIFCRNAFIYFSPAAVRRVVDTFADIMPRPGFLFVGASESLLSVTDRFTLDELDRAFVYTKR